MKSFVGFCWIFPPFARKIEKRPSHTLFFHREYIYRVIESSRGVLLCRQFRAVSLSFLYSQGSMGIMGGLLELVLENYYLVVTRYAVDHVYRVFFYTLVCVLYQKRSCSYTDTVYSLGWVRCQK